MDRANSIAPGLHARPGRVAPAGIPRGVELLGGTCDGPGWHRRPSAPRPGGATAALAAARGGRRDHRRSLWCGSGVDHAGLSEVGAANRSPGATSTGRAEGKDRPRPVLRARPEEGGWGAGLVVRVGIMMGLQAIPRAAAGHPAGPSFVAPVEVFV